LRNVAEKALHTLLHRWSIPDRERISENTDFRLGLLSLGTFKFENKINERKERWEKVK
jgi:hypothetical protein